MALTVTDGFIAGKAAGCDVSLCGTYIKSPLIWACSVCKNSDVEVMEDLKPEKLGRDSTRWGVSRMGSGSHTMGIYASKKMSVSSDSLEFIVANNFKGLRDGINTNAFDAFLWEHFTSKPYSGDGDEAHWRRTHAVARIQFCHGQIFSRGKITATDIQKLFVGIARGVELFVNGGQDTIDRICREHKHTREDAISWLNRTQWAIESEKPMALDKSHYIKSIEILKDTGLVPAGYDVEKLWDGNEAAVFV